MTDEEKISKISAIIAHNISKYVVAQIREEGTKIKKDILQSDATVIMLQSMAIASASLCHSFYQAHKGSLTEKTTADYFFNYFLDYAADSYNLLAKNYSKSKKKVKVKVKVKPKTKVKRKGKKK